MPSRAAGWGLTPHLKPDTRAHPPCQPALLPHCHTSPALPVAIPPPLSSQPWAVSYPHSAQDSICIHMASLNPSSICQRLPTPKVQAPWSPLAIITTTYQGQHNRRAHAVCLHQTRCGRWGIKVGELFIESQGTAEGDTHSEPDTHPPPADGDPSQPHTAAPIATSQIPREPRLSECWGSR